MGHIRYDNRGYSLTNTRNNFLNCIDFVGIFIFLLMKPTTKFVKKYNF